MTRRTDRRTFFRNATAAAVGTMGALSATGGASAIEPVQREVAGTKYKFALAGYSYRKLLTGNHPECTLEDFVRDCAEFGIEGTEPTSYYFPQPVTTEYLCRLKALAFRLGL